MYVRRDQRNRHAHITRVRENSGRKNPPKEILFRLKRITFVFEQMFMNSTLENRQTGTRHFFECFNPRCSFNPCANLSFSSCAKINEDNRRKHDLRPLLGSHPLFFCTAKEVRILLRGLFADFGLLSMTPKLFLVLFYFSHRQRKEFIHVIFATLLLCLRIPVPGFFPHKYSSPFTFERCVFSLKAHFQAQRRISVEPETKSSRKLWGKSC